MKIVGITGGIGTGKTTVAKIFNELGIPVYIADDEAKALMNRSKVIRRKLVALFGEKAYSNNTLNRLYIADKIFNDKELLTKMNAIVHPKVGQHFNRWIKKQKKPYVLKESALLFESGGDAICDYIILVTAPKSIRIQRVLERDNTTKEKVEAIIGNQMSDSEKLDKVDFVIVNELLEEIEKQVQNIHDKLLADLK